MTSSVRRGGYEPLPEMGEYVCDCYEHGTGEPWAHVGSSHVHERIVRCKDCKWSSVHDGNSYPGNVFKQYVGMMYCVAWGDGMQGEWTKPDGFCHRGRLAGDVE